VKGGRGGDGLVGFSHLPKQPKGGPDGGDGGKGGDVYFQASEEYHSLKHIQKDTFLKAEDGAPGGKNKRHGKNGKELTIYVPPGTTVCEKDKKEPLADLISDGEKVKVAEGGAGGKGNINFATSTNQAPRIATKGKEGSIKTLELTFSPKADIGVIGPANSGKSSLIACLTGSSPRIAGYPFTTKKPRLWTYAHNFSRYVFLDTPPLIPEAEEELKILLRRTQTLLIVLDCTLLDSFDIIKPIIKDIKNSFEKDPRKKIAYILTKTDKPKANKVFVTSHPVFPVSFKNEDGIEELKEFLFGPVNLG
jgi:GTP-binding protein